MAPKPIMAQQFGDCESEGGQEGAAGVQVELSWDEGDCPLFADAAVRVDTPLNPFKKGTVPFFETGHITRS